MQANHLKSAFWDYPQLQSESAIRNILKKNDKASYFWFMSRFIEYARVIDTLKYFSISEIRDNLEKLKLRPYTRNKWNRLVEVYSKRD